jgi:hypothetical protein
MAGRPSNQSKQGTESATADSALVSKSQAKRMQSVLQPGKKVILRPLRKRTWSGFHRFPKCQDTIIAYKRREGYQTGLTADEQRELEREMRLPEGELHSNSDFWKSYVFRLGDKDTILDLGIAVDVINLRLALQSPRVAKSMSRLNETPKADYVIYDVVEDSRNENRQIELKVEAAAIFAKLSQADHVDFLKLMGYKPTNTQADVVKNQLYKAMEKSPEEFLRIANLSDKETRILINDLVTNNILRVQGGHYMHGTVDIGYDLNTAVNYLDDPNNQDLRINLMQQLESVKKLRY